MLSVSPCSDYTSQLLLRCWQSTLSFPYPQFPLFLLLHQIENLLACFGKAPFMWLCCFTLHFTCFTSLFYPLKDSSWQVLWLNLFDSVRAFMFHSYSFKWHCNFCPSIKATVHNLQVSSLLPSDLSFSFLISRFLYERSFFSSIAGPFLSQFCHPLSHRTCSLQLPLSVWRGLWDPVIPLTQSDFPSLLKDF